MKNRIIGTALMVLLLFMSSGLKGQCTIEIVPENTLFPLGIEGTAFQLSSAIANPLPYTVVWNAPGAIVLVDDPSIDAILLNFPTSGIYTVCADVIDDVSGSIVCSLCLDYLYGIANPCGDVVVSNTADASIPGLYFVESSNLDSVDLASITWSTDGGVITSISATTPNITVEFPAEGIYDVCMNYIALNGDVCSACTVVEYPTPVGLPCITDIQYSVAIEGTYEYFVYATFSEAIDYNTLVWNTGNATQVPVTILPGIPGIIQVDFGAPGIYTVCATAVTLSGDICDYCVDVVVDEYIPEPCVAGMSISPIPQPGLFFNLDASVTTSTQVDWSTLQWSLDGGFLTDPDATLSDINIDVEFPAEGPYTICVNVSDLDGNDCSTCLDVTLVNYVPQPCQIEIFSDVWNPATYEYFITADILGDVDWSTLTWDFGGGTGTEGPIFGVNNFQNVVFPGPGTYTVCASAVGSDGVTCSSCIDVIVDPYVPQPCVAQIIENSTDPVNYVYNFFVSFGGDLDYTTVSWNYTGGTVLYSDASTLQLQFPGQGTYDVCVDAVGLDGAICAECITVVVDEYVPQPCVASLQYFISSPADYMATVFVDFQGDVDYNTITWDFGGGVFATPIDPIGLNYADIIFPAPGTYTVCVTATSLDGTDCSACVDVIVDPYIPPPCEAGFWYYQDDYTGTYYFEAYTNYGQGPFTYEWIIPELGLAVSDSSAFALDSVPGGLSFSLCLYVTDVNGDVCDYCEWVDDGTIFPPVLPGDGCLDWAVIDLNAVCPEIYDPVCGCDGITYENSCIAEQCFGVVQYTAGPCPGYVDPTIPTDPNVCTGEFFYFGQPNGNGGIDLFFFGFGNNADDFVWDLGNGVTTNGPDAYLTIPDTVSLAAYTVCMTTVSFWDTCSVTICETLVLDATPDGWIAGFVFDNSDEIGGGGGQVERVMNSDGTPLPGTIVELVDWNGNILESVVTDVDGAYSFTELYFGDYHVHVNIDGATHIPFHIVLDPTAQYAEEINFELRQNGEVLSGVEDLDFASAIHLFPNPTTSNVTLTLEMLETTELNISIYDIRGRQLYQSTDQAQVGLFSKPLEMSSYASGIYWVTIQSGKEILTQKVVKK